MCCTHVGPSHFVWYNCHGYRKSYPSKGSRHLLEGYTMNSSIEIAGIDWSSDRMLPAFQAPQHLDVYTIHRAPQDIQLSVSTLVGLINRPQPKVYLVTGDSDLFWFNEVFT